MQFAQLPFLIIASQPVRALLGPNLSKAALVAVRAILLHHKSLEVAHQQIRFGKHHLVFSSRIGSKGDLILEIDIGNPGLNDRVVFEDDLRHAEKAARTNSRKTHRLSR